MDKCPRCGYPDTRSSECSTHLNGHITAIVKEMKRRGMYPAQSFDSVWQYVHDHVLVLACEIDPVEGGAEYPHYIEDGRLHPFGSSKCNNKQVMTAIEAAHRYAAERLPEYALPERWKV